MILNSNRNALWIVWPHRGGVQKRKKKSLAILLRRMASLVSVSVVKKHQLHSAHKVQLKEIIASYFRSFSKKDDKT